MLHPDGDVFEAGVGLSKHPHGFPYVKLLDGKLCWSQRWRRAGRRRTGTNSTETRGYYVERPQPGLTRGAEAGRHNVNFETFEEKILYGVEEVALDMRCDQIHANEGQEREDTRGYFHS